MPDLDQTQRVRWLTTSEVIRCYGFNPEPFLTDREPKIRAKLQPIVVPDVGVVTQRMWLMDSVLNHPAATSED